MTLAERLAAFAAGLAWDDVPPAVVESVKLRTLDILGIALTASTHEFAPAVRGALEAWGGRGDCTVVGAKVTAAAPPAPLPHATLAHGLDFDDTHPASITHAFSVGVPTALALRESP